MFREKIASNMGLRWITSSIEGWESNFDRQNTQNHTNTLNEIISF